jgi:hypothetical protein
MLLTPPCQSLKNRIFLKSCKKGNQIVMQNRFICKGSD